jgi:hypothetical protein
MTRDMAKAMCQHFMDARLIENAVDPSSNLFKERGVYQLTPKGLHVLERFISKNGINADHISHVFQTQPICMKLLHLERRSVDDEIIVSQAVITALFRRFVGRQPNYSPENFQSLDPYQTYQERSKGLALMDVTERSQAIMGRATTTVQKYCFAAVSALEWLCDFTSVIGREEAAEMAAQFVRFGLIALVSDKRKNNDSAIIFTVRGSAPTGSSIGVSPLLVKVSSNLTHVSQQHGEFRCTAKAIYRITDEGRRLAHWDAVIKESPSTSTTNVSSAQRSSLEVNDPKLNRRASATEKPKDGEKKAMKESNIDRLRNIIEEPALRSRFREFLRENFCEENLSFWLEAEDFKKKFSITSSAMASGSRANTKTSGQAAMERHHEVLINTAFEIYNTYLAPSSQCELNIDHGLRNELSAYLNDVMTSLTGKAFQGRVELEQASAFNATQLQVLIDLYKRIQMHVFRLMAADSVPKVRYLYNLLRAVMLTDRRSVRQNAQVPCSQEPWPRI